MPAWMQEPPAWLKEFYTHESENERRDSERLTCTSEKEVCLPANYSRFQLPNKGRQSVVSIGKETRKLSKCKATCSKNSVTWMIVRVCRVKKFLYTLPDSVSKLCWRAINSRGGERSGLRCVNPN